MKENLINGKKMKVFFKNLLGELSWIATQTRPDLSSDVCLMTSSVNYCTIKELSPSSGSCTMQRYSR